MAELPEQTFQMVFDLQRRLLAILHQAKATERMLLDNYGDIRDLQADLNELQSLAQTAASRCQRLSTLLLRLSEAQPIASPSILAMLFDTIGSVQASLGAFERSIEEVRQNWRQP